jgi:hypothetical protein
MKSVPGTNLEMKASGKLRKEGGPGHGKTTITHRDNFPKETLADLGVLPNQSSQWQQLAGDGLRQDLPGRRQREKKFRNETLFQAAFEHPPPRR